MVLDHLARDLVARGDELDRDVRTAPRGREDLEEFERQDPAIREVQDAVVRELHRGIEDPRVRGLDREQPRVDREVADVPSRRIPNVVVQRDDLVLVQLAREQVREEDVLGVEGLEIGRPQSVRDRVREDD